LFDFLKIISELNIEEGVYRPNASSIEVTKAALTCQKRFIEIGTGSGFTSLILYLNGFEGIATDISKKAIECAKRNFKKFNIKATPVKSDLFNNLNGNYGLIIFNPPTNINEDENERSIKNYLKKTIPLIILSKVKLIYQIFYSYKRRKYLLSFIDTAKKHLNNEGEIIINFIKIDVNYFKSKLERYNVKIFSSNDESSVFIIKP
jgi:methylase of polypeptide subunit release factors